MAEGAQRVPRRRVLEGKVTKVVAFGAFVEIVPGVEGLVHISELAEHHVESPGDVVTPGQEVWVRILEIDEERRRISLSRQARRDRQHAAARPDARRADRRSQRTAGGRARRRGSSDLGLSEEVFADAAGRAGRGARRRGSGRGGLQPKTRPGRGGSRAPRGAEPAPAEPAAEEASGRPRPRTPPTPPTEPEA